MCQRCEDPNPVSEAARRQYEIYKTLNWSLLYGRAGEGKNYAAASKVLEKAACVHRGEALQCRYVGGSYIVGYLRDEEAVKVPQKICNYPKHQVHWFGEPHGSNNLVYNPGTVFNSFGWEQKSRHWEIDTDKLFLKGRDPKNNMSVFPVEPVGSITGRPDDFFNRYVGDEIEKTFRGKRFIGISEVEQDKMSNDFLMRFTGEEVTTRTLSTEGKPWIPRGEIIFMSGSKPPKINDKSKETIEQVERIEHP